MVNNTDFSPPPPITDPLLPGFFPNIPVPSGTLPSSDLSVPSKVAQERLSKESTPRKGDANSLLKLATLIAVFPSLKALPKELATLLNSITIGGGEKPGKPEGQRTDATTLGPFAPLPVALANMRAVLSILYYVSRNIGSLEPETLDALQAIMQPLADQLIRPVKKSDGGELTPEHREILAPQKEGQFAASFAAKRTPLPPGELQAKPERAMSEHTVRSGLAEGSGRPIAHPLHPSLAKELAKEGTSTPLPPNPSPPRARENVEPPKSHTPTDQSLKLEVLEIRAPIASLSGQERTTILAAPFQAQQPISAAPYKKKKNPKSWEEEEESFEEDENPSKEDKF